MRRVIRAAKPPPVKRRKIVRVVLAAVLTVTMIFGSIVFKPLGTVQTMAADTPKRVTSLKTSNDPNEQAIFSITDGKVTVGGLPKTSRFNYVQLQVTDSSGKLTAINSAASKNGASCPVGNLKDGEYSLKLFISETGKGTFAGYIIGSNNMLRVTSGEATFAPSPVYEACKAVRESKRADARAADYYLLPSIGVESEDPRIKKLAAEATKDTAGAYAKARAIHDWVAANIWYDYDALNGGERPAASAVAISEQRRGLCYGYAFLTAALLRASGIPAKVVSGYGLGAGSYNGSGWTEEKVHAPPNHIWNEALIDGRWIIMDVTWDSGNRWSGGRKETTAGFVNGKYFDPTTEFFSLTHRIDDYSESDIYDVGNPHNLTGYMAIVAETLQKGYIIPKPVMDGLNANRPIQEDEFVAMLWNVFVSKNRSAGDYCYSSDLEDVNRSVYANAINGAIYHGIMTGNLSPRSSVGAAELVELLYHADSAINGSGSALSAPMRSPPEYQDGDMSKQTREYAAHCVKRGLLPADINAPGYVLTVRDALVASYKLLTGNASAL